MKSSAILARCSKAVMFSTLPSWDRLIGGRRLIVSQLSPRKHRLCSCSAPRSCNSLARVGHNSHAIVTLHTSKFVHIMSALVRPLDRSHLSLLFFGPASTQTISQRYQTLSKRYPDSFGPGILGLFVYTILLIMWLKFLVIWRVFRFWALCDGVEPPENMMVRRMSIPHGTLYSTALHCAALVGTTPCYALLLCLVLFCALCCCSVRFLQCLAVVSCAVFSCTGYSSAVCSAMLFDAALCCASMLCLVLCYAML